MTGKLIVLEGVDGAGTTTQAERLGSYLRAQGYKVHVTREPTAGPVGQLIRQILGGAHAPFDPTAMALLFAADRRDHLQREIEPRLAEGVHVLSDRYVLSSYVYQSRFVDPELVWQANAQARPADLTLLLDVSAEVAAARRKLRGGVVEIYERDDLQRQLVEAYRNLPAEVRRRERLLTVDGTPPPDRVFEVLVGAVESCVQPTGTAS